MAKKQKSIDPALSDALLAGQDPKTVLSSKGLLGARKPIYQATTAPDA
jgi:hypothetical protein